MTNEYFYYNHGKLYYEVTGNGQPIVFIHGFTLDHRMWQPQVDFFTAGGFKVVTYDARGFGQSSVPAYAYSHDDDLQALLAHLGVPQAHVVGLSMGGRIAINFALAQPSMIKTLTVMDSALDGYSSEVDWNVHPEAGLEQARINWINHELFQGLESKPDITTILESIVADYSGWHWLNPDLQNPKSTNARNRLHNIKAPTLVMVGEHDLPYFQRIAAVITTDVPNAHAVAISGTGHMINLEAASRCNQLILKHIEVY